MRAAAAASGRGLIGVIGTAGTNGLFGQRGDDVIRGLGSGSLTSGHMDVLAGDLGNDRILGGGGADLIESDNRRRDVISCGPGVDSVLADNLDRIARDCERVRRG